MNYLKIIHALFILLASSVAVTAQSQIAMVKIDGKTPSITSTELEYSAPAYIGGQEALEKFIEENLTYPKLAIRQGLEGTVHVVFKITAQGEIQEASIKLSCNPLLDEAAMALITEMPNWYPAELGGKAQEVYYQLPITFQLL